MPNEQNGNFVQIMADKAADHSSHTIRKKVVYDHRRPTFLFSMDLIMKRSYAYLLATAGIVAVISGVAIAQQATAPAPAATPAAAPAPAVAEAAPAAVAAPFSIDQVQNMPVGVERGKKIAEGLCAACHNADGNSVVPLQPKLAGQHMAYLEKQMHDFKVAEGAKEPLRGNMLNDKGESTISTMKAQVELLSKDPKQFDNDVKSLALWFNTQKLVPASASNADPASSNLGKRIYTGGIVSKGVPACAGCHSPTGSGIPNKYPHVSGQFADYAVVQLKAFREDVRTNSPQNQMQDIAKRLTDAEIKAVADYMAGVR